MKTKESKKEAQLIIAVRHGEYDDRGLTCDGVQQVQDLASRLRQIIPKGHTVAVLSSPMHRAVQSAEIIARKFLCSHTVHSDLSSDDSADGELLMQVLTKEYYGETVVAITHYDAPSGIIDAFSRKYFKTPSPPFESPKGNGCMICLKTGKISTRIL